MANPKPLTRERLDEIAAKEGFIFKLELNDPNLLYKNGELNRVYDSRTGRIVNEYKPISRKRFHNPITSYPIKFTKYNFQR